MISLTRIFWRKMKISIEMRTKRKKPNRMNMTKLIRPPKTKQFLKDLAQIWFNQFKPIAKWFQEPKATNFFKLAHMNLIHSKTFSKGVAIRMLKTLILSQLSPIKLKKILQVIKRNQKSLQKKPARKMLIALKRHQRKKRRRKVKKINICQLRKKCRMKRSLKRRRKQSSPSLMICLVGAIAAAKAT